MFAALKWLYDKCIIKEIKTGKAGSLHIRKGKTTQFEGYIFQKYCLTLALCVYSTPCFRVSYESLKQIFEIKMVAFMNREVSCSHFTFDVSAHFPVYGTFFFSPIHQSVYICVCDGTVSCPLSAKCFQGSIPTQHLARR